MAPASHGLRPAWLGIDVGTQSVRAVVVDVDGRLLGSGAAALRSDRPHPGRHEQDPEEWWAALGRAARDALARAAASDGGSAAIGGLAICSTSGTMLLTDDAGRVRSPVLMYDDSRARVENERVRAAEGVVANRASRPAHPSSAVGRLLWLLDHSFTVGSGGPSAASGAAQEPVSPSIAAGAESPNGGGLRLTHCADLLAGRIVGAPVATDESHALKSGYDPELRAWRIGLFDALGIPQSVLPEVVAPGTLLGVVSREASVHCGVTAGTPVLAGMTDSCAAQIAAGALEPGSWSSVLGTTLAVKGVCAEPIVDAAAGVYSHRHPDGSAWLAGGASNVGAGVLSEDFGGRDLAALDAAAAAHEPSGAVLYPLAVGVGERFPFRRPDAAAIQLGRPRDEADHFAALLQGVAFAERLCLERMRALGAAVHGPLRLTGGGARSDYWCQLRADILGRGVRRPAHPEPAVGMAILAAAGDDSVTEASLRMVHNDLSLEPRADRAGRFEEAYRRLCDELVGRGYLASAGGDALNPCTSLTPTS